MPRKQQTPFTLTARDIDVLEHITSRRGVPIEHVAARFFSTHPFTGKPNRNAKRACDQRVRALVRAGFLALVREHDGRQRRQMVILANGVNGMTCKRASNRRVSARNGAHHVRTQDALAKVERGVKRVGGRVLSVRLEADVRADEQRGKRTAAGDEYPAFPDAVCRVEVPVLGVGEIAVEYVTSKYTDADILKKHESFGRFHAVIWVADRPRTAERVKALTRKPCHVLR
jgi:hypothetical protein